MSPSEFQLFPDAASAQAAAVDHLFFFLCALTAVFSAGISAAVIYFSVRYHRSHHPEAVPIEGDLKLELTWTIVPFVICMGLFVWGAKVYFDHATVPADATEIFVTGKQWMWKVQHGNGRREINSLHVPEGRPIKLTMTSEDVIHSFFIPAFRVKNDVLPGRYTTLWFTPTKVGTFHLFCAEYCGTKHSQMIGSVVVLPQDEFERWLSGDTGETLVEAGQRLFSSLGCKTCHSRESGARGPDLAGLFGRTVNLGNGTQAKADEGYLRESVLDPFAKVVAGYDAVMPTYRGQVDEEGVVRLVAYIKSLAQPAGKGTR